MCVGGARGYSQPGRQELTYAQVDEVVVSVRPGTGRHAELLASVPHGDAVGDLAGAGVLGVEKVAVMDHHPQALGQVLLVSSSEFMQMVPIVSPFWRWRC